MVLMTVLSLVAAAIAVANLMAASIGERGSELALMRRSVRRMVRFPA